MKNVRNLIFICCGIVVLHSCNGANDDQAESIFISKTTLIDTTYPPIDQVALDIMEKLQLCTLNDTVVTMPPCSSDYFRVFQYRTDKTWSDGFIVEMIPGLYGSPVHQVIIIENYFGKYRIVNQYLGALLEIRTKENGYSDLLIAYTDPDIGVVAIRHEWQEQKYDVVDVEEINNHYVKAEMKDSVNAIFLPAFAAGH